MTRERIARCTAGLLGGTALAAVLTCTALGAALPQPVAAHAEEHPLEADTPVGDVGACDPSATPEVFADTAGAPGETLPDQGAQEQAAPILRALTCDGEPAGCALVAEAQDGGRAVLSCGEEGLLDPESLFGLAAGPCLLRADQGWEIVGARADAGLESERTLEPAEGALALELPLEGLSSLEVFVRPAAEQRQQPPAPAGGQDAEQGQQVQEAPQPPEEAPDQGPTGPDMSGALATGVPMAGGWSSDPLDVLLQVAAERREAGSGVAVAWSDPASGRVGYTRT